MNKTKFTFAIAASLLLFAIGHFTQMAAQARAQTPKQEKLLNGMKVHFWPDQSSNKVDVKIRIHSGAAFDTQGNEGQTCLTAEALFPNTESREFFRDDLGGHFEIVCGYDSVEINVSSRPDAILSMLETLAAAVTTPTLDKETTDSIKPAQLAKIEALSKNAAFTADSAVSKIIFGSFPYGRPVLGTPETLANIDFADLRFSYGRSFGADNVTMAIIGNFDQPMIFRAVRRYFGAWLKSDNKIPATFRQPDAPDQKLRLLDSPEPGVGELRVAIRGTARNSADNAAFDVLAKVLETRLRAKAPADKRELTFVKNDAHLLPGMLSIGMSGLNTGVKTDSNDGTAPKTEDPISQIFSEKITDSEFAAAKLVVINDRSKVSPAALWLDVDTFKLASAKAEQDSYIQVTLADVQKAAAKAAALPRARVMLLSDDGKKEGVQ